MPRILTVHSLDGPPKSQLAINLCGSTEKTTRPSFGTKRDYLQIPPLPFASISVTRPSALSIQDELCLGSGCAALPPSLVGGEVQENSSSAGLKIPRANDFAQVNARDLFWMPRCIASIAERARTVNRKQEERSRQT
jgi:hypothetical protein